MTQRINITIPGPGPWGFRLAGGRDFNQPLYISKVTPGGKAHRAAVVENDTLLAINGQDVRSMTHLEAQNMIKGVVGNLTFSLERSAEATIWTPEVSGEADQGGFNISLKANKQQFQHAGSSHNVKPRLFPGGGGAGQTPSPQATMVHKQFNSPVGMYSRQNVADSFKGQTDGLSLQGGVEEPAPPPAWQQPSSYRGGQPQAPNPGTQSRSFRMVEQLAAEDQHDYGGPTRSQPAQPAPDPGYRPGGTRSVRAPVAKPSTGGAQPASTLPVCSKCNRNIMGPFVKVRGNPLHDTCFTCESCGLSLRNKGDGEGFFVVNEKLYCESCKNRVQRQPAQVNGSASKPAPPPVANVEELVYQNGNSAPQTYAALDSTGSNSAQGDSDIASLASETSSSDFPDPPAFINMHAPVSSHSRDDDYPDSSSPDHAYQRAGGDANLSWQQQQQPKQENSKSISVLASTPEPWNPNESYTSPVIRSVRAPTVKSSARPASPAESNSGPEDGVKVMFVPRNHLGKPPSQVAQASRNPTPKGFYSATTTIHPQNNQDDMAAPPPPPPPPTGHQNYAWRANPPAAPRPSPPPAAYRPGPPPAPKSQPPRAVFPQPPPSMLQQRSQPAPPPPAQSYAPPPPAPSYAPPPPIASRAPVAPPPAQRGPPPPAAAPARGGGGGAAPIAPGLTRTPYCEGCNEPVRGTFVTAFGRNWHPEHFVCAHCHENLQGKGVIEDKGKIYCEEDYMRLYAPKCSRCMKSITGECVKAMGSEYHPGCFTCVVCNEPITGDGFHVQDGQTYCKRDFQNKFRGVNCGGCNFPIEAGEAWLEALDRSYHAECFTCTQCQQRLEGQRFYAKGNRPYCQAHGS